MLCVAVIAVAGKFASILILQLIFELCNSQQQSILRFCVFGGQGIFRLTKKAKKKLGVGSDGLWRETFCDRPFWFLCFLVVASTRVSGRTQHADVHFWLVLCTQPLQVSVKIGHESTSFWLLVKVLAFFLLLLLVLAITTTASCQL